MVTEGVSMQAWRPATVLGQTTGTVMVQPPDGIVKALLLTTFEPGDALRLLAVQVLPTVPVPTTSGAGRLSVRLTLLMSVGVPLDSVIVSAAVLSLPPR